MKYWQRVIKIPLIFSFIGIIAFQLIFSLKGYSQVFTFPDKQKRSFINFEFIKNLIVIPIYINNKGPYNFILDTGAGPLIITEPTLIDTLGLKNLRSTKIRGLGQGEEIDAFVTGELNAQIKEASINNIPTAILKKDIFNLSSYLGKKIYGIIGFYFFNSFVVKVNYTNQRVSFILPDVKIKKRGAKFPIEIENKKPYITVDLQTPQLNNVKVKLIVDCGAGHALSMEALNGAPFPLPDSSVAANLGVGLSGLIDGRVGRIPLLKLGNYKFKNIITGFPAFESVAAQIGYNSQDGNLGAEFLRRFDMTYDYPNNAIYFKPNQGYNLPFDHDMSGMEVYTDPDNNKRYFIGRIEPGSSAEKHGFLEQDEIVGIDFKLAELYSLEEITKLFKSDNGKTIVVEIIRNDKNIIKLLKLKRRI
ncbi:peptide-binding protein [Pedobacter frigiditerrae]|uniref:Peptide-binding protein n=1 Tax=Pedobacter frigiditerrae TaxID=2530452 RepID=A0A4R0N1X6_9SPHI|nr:aspartyl protease family protein [Pedobacter frigiditerrae]TCC93791.1 peptide-binding protein [Pedobacter frigiditerrae]